MEASSPLIANPLIVLREEFDWAILFDPDTGSCHGLSPTGVFVWKHLDGWHTPEKIVEKLKEVCLDVPDTAREDIESFLKDLAQRGMAGHEVRE